MEGSKWGSRNQPWMTRRWRPEREVIHGDAGKVAKRPADGSFFSLIQSVVVSNSFVA
jgi:hypothetical protein